jgi:uncharacterized tellurite resistance protein B-like protein
MHVWGLLFLCFIAGGWPLCGSTSAAEQSADELLLDAFNAERAGGDPGRIAEKFEAVIKADPENYYALVKLGSMKMAEPGSSPELAAINYLLRAAIAMPNNPEAFLYLAQLYYKMGYIIEGDRYLRMCEGINRRLVYDAICLSGWRYEESGNYFEAIMTYAPAALSPDSKFMGDPFLFKRLYEAAQLSQPPYDWVYGVTRLLFQDQGQEIIDMVNNSVLQAFVSNPRLEAFHKSKDAANSILRDLIVSELKPYVAMLDKVPESYEVPAALHKTLFCSPEELRSPRFTDPYEAFVAASPESARDKAVVLREVKKIRDQALKEISTVAKNEEKAKVLYGWLKKNVLRDYSALDGDSAKSIVEMQKFDSLSGTILYVLIAQDAKLQVKAFLVPGHAFAVMDEDRPIWINVAAEGSQGFDVKEDVMEKFRERNPAFERSGFEPYGQISDPMRLVAFLFVDSAVKNVDRLVLNRNESLFRKVLQEDFALDDTAQSEVIEGLRQQGSARVASPNGTVHLSLASPQFAGLIRKMAASDSRFRKGLLVRYDEGIALLKTAKQLAPLDARFGVVSDDLVTDAARSEYDTANAGTINRAAQRAKAFLTAAESDFSTLLTATAGTRGPEALTGNQRATLEDEQAKITEEERQLWPGEAQGWLNGLKRIAAEVKQHPCNERLRRSLAAVYAKALATAERRQDAGTADEIKRIASTLLP